MKTTIGTERSMVMVILSIALFVLLPCMGHTAIPQKINYQGYLTTSAGSPVNGTVQMVFSIYNVSSGGSALWTETQNVTVSHGVYNVNLGEVTPITLTFDIPYYLGVTVVGDPEMTPRKILTSVGYAFRAQTVESAGAHTHSGEDITSGTIAEVRIDSQITRDSEVMTIVKATDGTGSGLDADLLDGIHAAGFLQAGQTNSITSGMIVNGTIAFADVGQNGCGTNQIMKWSGSAWICATDEVGGGGGLTLPYSGTAYSNGNAFSVTNMGHPTTPSSHTAIVGLAPRTGDFNNAGGVFGAAGNTGVGVSGEATGSSGTGVKGRATGSSGVGVYGENADSQNIGQLGTSLYGVSGGSQNGTGVFGSTGGTGKTGVYGYAAQSSSYGVVGVNVAGGSVGRLGSGTTGVYGHTNQSGAWAGFFEGNVHATGNVGIGTTSPQQKLHVAGVARFDVGVGQIHMSSPGNWPGIIAYTGNGNRRDIFFDNWGIKLGAGSSPSPPAVSVRIYENGRLSANVLEITGGSDLSEQFEIRKPSKEIPLEPGMVVVIDPENPGRLVVSSKAYDRKVAGIISGAGGVSPGMLMGQKGSEADGAHPVALTGRVYCWADASNESIEPGDLLTTSEIPGHAMRATDYANAQGAILGKAMSSLKSGQGLVLVLVSLQ